MKKIYEFLSADMVAEEVELNGDKGVSFVVAINQIANSDSIITLQEKKDFLGNLRELIDLYQLTDEPVAIITEIKDRYLHVSIFKL